MPPGPPTRAAFLAFVFVTLTVTCTIAADDAGEAFDDPRNSQAETQRFLSPEEALRSIELPDGFHATVFASEPDVRQPIAITTDERGRLWVAENYTYARSDLNFDDTLRDRIVILEDSTDDGVADKRTVFWDGGRKLTSVEVGHGGVWALCAPQLLFIPDKNRDDVPDGEPEVVLDGWDEDKVRHNIVNGLAWGPDGWLYGLHGILATSSVGRTGDPPSKRRQINCGVWRYHPTRKTFEPVAHGGTNPWGFDYNEHGEMFFINTVIGHLWHLVPGAHYERMYGSDFNPHLYELMPQTADHVHWDTGEKWSDIRQGVTDSTSKAGGGHAHTGLMIYHGDNWPEEYRGNAFTLNLHGRRINHDRLERTPAGYVARHAADMFNVGDPWFRGIDLVYGPDGGVFIADWSDIGECHENDGVHRTSGRIYKLTYGKPTKTEPFDLSKLNNEQLVELQLKNEWHARQARRILADRAAGGVDPTAATAFLNETRNDVRHRLRMLWTLYVTDGIDEPGLNALLHDPQEHVRVWAVRLLGDRGMIGAATAKRLAAAAKKEESALVRLYLASAMQRMAYDDRWEVASALTFRRPTEHGRPLSLMIWYGIEPAVPEDSGRAVELAAASRMPLVRRHAARRLTYEIDEAPSAIDALLKIASKGDAAFQQDVLSGMNAALKGRLKAPTPAAWSVVAATLAKSPDSSIRATVRELGVVFGDGRAVDELRAIVDDEDAEVAVRRHALRALVRSRNPELVGLLQALANSRELGTEAVEGLAAFDHPATPKTVLAAYPRLRPVGREAAIATLTSRPAYARELLAAVRNGRIDRQEITAFHARQIRSFGDESLTRELSELWGSIRETSAEKKQQIAVLKQAYSNGALDKADPIAGRALFKKNCANCHTLYGDGGNIGPDLTGSNRRNLDYLLENIVDPGATLAESFKVSVVVLTSGRVLTGVVTHARDKTVTIQTQKDRVVLSRDEIEKIVPQNASLMPDGILKPLSDEQRRDLFAYLSGLRQVPLPASE